MNMENQNFTYADLVSFGNYLLSQQRAKTIKARKNGPPASELKSRVMISDLENWKIQTPSAIE